MFLLTRPSVEYEASYVSYVDELGDSERYPFPLDYAYDNFEALVARLNDYSSGKGLVDGMVPNTTFWLIEDGEIVGVSNLRHYLTERLNRVGGHIGFGVRPSAQGRGVAKELLNRTIRQARSLGIADVVLICLKDNSSSSGVIRSVGGQLEKEFKDVKYVGLLQRYRIRHDSDFSQKTSGHQ